LKLESATAITAPDALRGTQILRTPKVSPFLLLNDDTLDRLAAVASEEPAVVDMVAGYRASVETAAMYGEILAEECSYYEVPIS
jgi:hypothetical protein